MPKGGGERGPATTPNAYTPALRGSRCILSRSTRRLHRYVAQAQRVCFAASVLLPLAPVCAELHLGGARVVA